MTSGDLGRLLLPVTVVLTVGLLFSIWLGKWYWIGALTGFGLVVPLFLAAALTTRWLVHRSPRSVLLGFFATMLVRSTALLLGGLIVFLAAGGSGARQNEVLAYWLLLLASYLAILVPEIMGLRKHTQRVDGTASGVSNVGEE
ncbi:hypothetical protein [Fimbriiglobus ruber]|uniref:hypothetical protein n=1 Tax=Fimbriiglobus ruber TaxID=1908690 RepID=UPI000B4BB82E|nr:hypothetical protein [Fimbriiglobus ruber]